MAAAAFGLNNPGTAAGGGSFLRPIMRSKNQRWIGMDDPDTPPDDVIHEQDIDTFISLSPERRPNPVQDGGHYRNMVDEVDPMEAKQFVGTLDERIKKDRESINGLLDKIAAGMKRLGFDPEETRSDPFPGASAVRVPMIAQAVVEHVARVRQELCPPGGMCKTVTGPDADDATIERATRLDRTMNYLFSGGIKGWDAELDKTLAQSSLIGTSYQKWSMYNNFPICETVALQDVLVPYNTTDLRTANRITHVLRMQDYEVRANMRSKKNPKTGQVEPSLWKDVPLLDPDEQSEYQSKFDDTTMSILGISRPGDAQDDRFVIHECYVRASFEPEIGEDLPYIVTYDPTTLTILAIQRNWWEGDEDFEARTWIIKWGLIRWFDSFYDYGFMHVLGNLNNAGTGALRAMIDAATANNIRGGFVSKAVKFATGDEATINPSQWVQVEVPGLGQDPDLQKHFLKNSDLGGADTTLFELLKYVDDKGSGFASVNTDGLKNAQQGSSATAALAIIENESIVYSGFHRRTIATFDETLQVVCTLLHRYLPDDPSAPAFYKTRKGGVYVTPSDFDGSVQVVPACDEAAFSGAQRTSQATAIAQMCMEMRNAQWDKSLKPAFLNHMRSLRVANPESYWPKDPPPPQPPPPVDVVTEMQNLLASKPVKAYPGQNHQAYIDHHMAVMNDDRFAKLPAFQQVLPAINAAIADHAGQMLLDDIQNQMGQPLPPVQQLNPQQQFMLSARVAQVAQQVAAQHPVQTEGGEQHDPAKLAEVQRKAAADQAKDALEKQKLDLEAEKQALEHTRQQEAAAAKAEHERLKLEHQREMEAIKHAHKLELQNAKAAAHAQTVDVQNAHKTDMQDTKIASTHAIEEARLAAAADQTDTKIQAQSADVAAKLDSAERIAGAQILAQVATAPALAKPAMEELDTGKNEG